MSTLRVVVCCVCLMAPAVASAGGPARTSVPTAREVWLEPGPLWKVVSLFSGRDSYYSIVNEYGSPVIHARYEPPAKTVILGAKLSKPDHFRHLSWSWRVSRFPVNADERVEGHMDNAASVYVTFVSTFKKHVLKYVWSTAYPAGTHWTPGDSTFYSELHVVVLEGAPAVTGEWRSELVSLSDDFHKYFGGDPDDEPPPLAGLGVLSDGDGTKTPVEADYAAFRFFD